MKVKVRATDASKKRNIAISDIHRIAQPGEEFEIDESRLRKLTGDNVWNLKFVEVVKEKFEKVEIKEEAKPKIEEPIPVPTDPTLKPAKVEEPIKSEKTTKKKTTRKKRESVE